jgi:putative transposase
MARLPRLHLPGAWYLLTLRSHQDRNLFPRSPQRELFEQAIAEAAAQTHIHVHGFCLLDTRVRLLVQITNIPIHNFLQLVSSRHTRAMRDSTAQSGRLFRERQDVLLFDGSRHLLDLLCVIHLEPVRCGAVMEPQDYPWSSHRDYLADDPGRASRPWLVTSLGLSLLHEQRSRACDAYRLLVASHAHEPPAPEDLRPHAKDPRILGNDAFLASVTLRAARATRNPALEHLTEEVCKAEQVTLEALRSPCQRRALCVARGLIASRALRQRTASLTEVARHLNRSVSAVARSAQRHGASLRAEP